MSDSIPPQIRGKSLPEPNPATQAAHRREVAWQVMIPFIGALVIFIGIVVALVGTGVGTVEQWAQIAVIFMSFFGLALGLVVLAVLVVLFFVITQVLKLLPPYARVAQDAIMQIDRQIKAGADISVKPVIEVQRFLAMVDVLLGKRKIKQ